jgi:triphosphoribosyl-dephospho-CoA synthase
VTASPKPGLVDRFNQGAHTDMDFFTFMDSSAALSNYFYDCAAEGAKHADRNPEGLFQALRALGIAAEKGMFEATKGVNTHKGLVFSLGIICAAASCCLVEKELETVDAYTVCAKVSQMTQGLCMRELTSLNQSEGLTYGERLFQKYGMKGIRGEVEEGFPTVRNYSLPVLKELKSMKTFHINDILVQTLLHLMSVNEDSNIVARHDLEMLEWVRQYAEQVINYGGMLTPKGIEMVKEMDSEFIRKNISPGGSADLLAVTVMFDFLSQ